MNAGLVRALVAGAAVLGTGSAIVAASGGGSIEIGPFLLRSHNPVRPVLGAIVLVACALAGGRGAVRDALTWWWDAMERYAGVAAAIVAAGAVAIGLAWGTFVAGGSDSYCYLNQAELFTRGEVRDFEPLALDPAFPGNVWSFAAAGHRPATNDPGYYVPICPAGYPLLLAGAHLMFGRTAMFWITPLMGGLGVFVAFVLGSRAGGRAAGLFTALLTASSPIVLYQIVQPMNDVPAAALWATALAVASSHRRNDARRPVLAGLVTAAALAVRPNLAPLAGVVGMGIMLLPRDQTRRQRVRSLALFGVAALPGVVLVMVVQAAMYGSPLSSGYGDLSAMFAASNIIPNLIRYPTWIVSVHTPLIAAGVAAPFLLRGQARRFSIWLLLFAAATFALYLPYVVYEAWWFQRFVLPAVPVLLALAAAVIAELLRRVRADARTVVFAAICVAFPLMFVSDAIRLDVFRLKSLEWRFRAGGEYVATLPTNAMMVTGHQSGSVRYYSGRRIAGWADIDPGRLDDAMRFFRERGLEPYLLLEDWEEAEFRKRFSSDRLGSLNWPPRAEIDGRVRVYDPQDYERHTRGAIVRTARITTTPR